MHKIQIINLNEIIQKKMQKPLLKLREERGQEKPLKKVELKKSKFFY